MDPAIGCLILLGVMALLFITELIPLAVTAMGGAIICGFLNFIPDNVVFSGLSHPTVTLFAGMFVVGAAMFHTGLAHSIGVFIVKRAGRSQKNLMLCIMIVAAVLSMCLSNTGTAACLLPVVMGICAAAKMAPSRQLLPLAYAVCSGGMISLVGTPPNIIVSGALSNFGYRPFGFFEFAWVGVPLTVLTILYMYFAGRRLLPEGGEVPEKFLAELDPMQHNVPKQVIAGCILLGCIIVMCLDLQKITIEMAAVIGALVCVLTGCLTEKQAYHSIEWSTIFLFAGMMPVSHALVQHRRGRTFGALDTGSAWHAFAARNNHATVCSNGAPYSVYEQFRLGGAHCPDRHCNCPEAWHFTLSAFNGNCGGIFLRLCNTNRHAAVYTYGWPGQLPLCGLY